MDIKVEIKRTKHSTPCKFCQKEISKGDLRIVIRSYGFHSQDSAYIHVPCFLDWIKNEMADLLKIREVYNPSRRRI